MTNVPSERVSVGPPTAELWIGRVEPGDYRLELNSTNWVKRGRPGVRFRMRATFPPQRGEPNSPLVPQGTVFLLHGYGLDSVSLLPWALTLAEAGYLSVLVDLRGHGDSSGHRWYLGTVETHDLMQVLDRLLAEGKVCGPIAVMGESLGAALALRWAAADERLSTAISLAPYAELAPTILAMRDEYAAWLPRVWVRDAVERLPGLLRVPAEALDTTPIVSRLETPVLLIAAGEDRVAPPRHIGRMARLAQGPVKYFTVSSAGHESLPYHFEELREPVLDWLQAYCRTSDVGTGWARQ
jgi:pimeloyl-ACP methyl ester carboxylesterase